MDFFSFQEKLKQPGPGAAAKKSAREILTVSQLTAQIERLLIAPIGRLAEQIPERSIERARNALTERITSAARERLPIAIKEFDIGGIVRNKVANYPVKKLEELVLSVAQQHLRTIELFGAAIGLFLGVSQALYFGIKYYLGNH